MVASPRDRFVRLPETQRKRIAALRDRMLESIDEATKRLGATLNGDVETMIEHIRGSGYRPSVIRRQVAWLQRRHGTRLAETISGQIKNAAELCERYETTISTYVSQGQPAPEIIAQTTQAFLARYGSITAEASLASDVAATVKVGPPVMSFPGDKILKTVPKWQRVRKLSDKLHGEVAAQSTAIQTQTLSAIREAKTLDKATSDLIRAVRQESGAEIASGREVSGLVRDVESAGRRLNARGGEKALKDWQRQRKRIRQYMGRLAEGGRVRRNLLELLQRTKEDSAKGIDRAIRHHAADVQRYTAERIIKTESQAAYVQRQILADLKHPIIGYLWHLSHVARRGYAKRTKPRKKLGGRRCICESLDGRMISVEQALERPRAHPHCMCWLEPVYDKTQMVRVTEEELAFEAQFD